MADVSEHRVTNIVSLEIGIDTYKGIREVSIQLPDVPDVPITNEGDTYPSSVERIGTMDFPVVFQFTTVDMAQFIALRNLAASTVVITYKARSGTTNKKITISNCRFRNPSQRQGLQQFGSTTIEGYAYSADGTTLPIAIADVA